MISVGDNIPSANIAISKSDETYNTTSTEFFKGKKVALFALPGAFTPMCSQAHLPDYVTLYDQFVKKGIDTVACLSVNDSFVMQAWGSDQNAENITMIADGGAALTNALGLQMDTADFGGIRSQRYAMIVDNGKVTLLNVEAAGEFEASKAETLLEAL